MKTLRSLLATIAAGLVGLASAQMMDVSWQSYSITPRSAYLNPVFAPNNRAVMAETWDNGKMRLVCKDGQGNQLWTYPLDIPLVNPKRILCTTDNKVYVTTNRYNPGLIVLDLNGNLLWSYSLPEAVDFTLQDCRIFGNDLLVVGTGRAVNLKTSPRTILLCLDRITGVEKYKREYLINNAAFTGAHAIRSAGGLAYIIATKNYGTGILKVDPANGDPLGTYAVGPYTAEEAEVDSTGQIYLTGSSNPATGGPFELRRVNGAGTGALPLIYRKTGIRGPMALSKSNLFIASDPNLIKVKPADGTVLWTKSPGANLAFDYVRADSQGRIYTMIRDFTHNGMTSWLNLVDPATGADLALLPMFDEGSPFRLNSTFALNSYGEVLLAGALMDGSAEYEGRAELWFSPPEPVDDTYSIAQGESLTTSGAGVLANDRYTNPSMTLCSLVTAPAKGKLLLKNTGEFWYQAKHDGNLIPVGTQSFRYRSTRQGYTREATVTLNITRGITSVTLARPWLAGFSAVSGKVNMTSSGPQAMVSLASSLPLVTVPDTVVIPANTPQGSFIANSAPVSVSTPVVITATYGTSVRSVTLTLVPVAVSSATCTPDIVGGNNAGMDVNLNGNAEVGGAEVLLSDSSPYVSLPPSITIPEGEKLGTAVVTTLPVTSTKYIWLEARFGGATVSCSIRVHPAP